MSIDHDSMTVIGFVVPVEEAFKKFIVKREGRFHMEPRWDAKTGNPIEPEKVIDEHGGFALVIDGEECCRSYADNKREGEDEICANVGDDEAQAIADLIKCEGFVTGDFMEGNTFACFQPSKLKATKDGVYLLKDVCKFQKEIERIGKALKKLGIDPGPGGIHTVNVVC